MYCLLPAFLFASFFFSQADSSRQRIMKAFIREYNSLSDATLMDTANLDKRALHNFRDVLKNWNYSDSSRPYGNINTSGNELMKILFQMEALTFSEEKISPQTRYLISLVKEPYVLVQLERAINEDISNANPGGTDYMFRQKILKEVSYQLQLIMGSTLPYYTYNTREKKFIKFVSVRSGNDLFTIAGIIKEFYPKGYYVPDNLFYFQRNDDRDYTGSFLLEAGTDYLNFLRKRPVKSYQTLLFGFDVYTPYFRDSVKFDSDTSYNALDRPHASFQYFGWSKKALSKYEKFRWSTTIKVGRIGGKTGERFQNALHQDVSYSPRPKGWGAQIADGGRLGISVECEHAYQFYVYNRKNENSVFNLNLSPFFEEKFGTYMTNVSGGVRIGNKKFSQANHNFIHHRTRQTVANAFDHLSWSVSFQATYVIHNTMLEGYGIVNSTEHKNDRFTPRSLYYLRYDQVRRWTYMLNVCASYTARFATFFYNWKSFSPETYLGKIGINGPGGNEMDISKRWHHFAEIGMTFNVH